VNILKSLGISSFKKLDEVQFKNWNKLREEIK